MRGHVIWPVELEFGGSSINCCGSWIHGSHRISSPMGSPTDQMTTLDPAHGIPYGSRNLVAGRVEAVLITTALGTVVINAPTTHQTAKFLDLWERSMGRTAWFCSHPSPGNATAATQKMSNLLTEEMDFGVCTYHRNIQI